jgi:hypothetical protein
MKLNKYLILFFAFILSFLAINEVNASIYLIAKNAVKSEILIADDNTYERVFHDGFWWIVVYAPDGSKITEYLDPIQ